MLREAVHVGEGAVEAGGGHEAMGGIGVHGGLGRRACWERVGQRGARDLHYVSATLRRCAVDGGGSEGGHGRQAMGRRGRQRRGGQRRRTVQSQGGRVAGRAQRRRGHRGGDSTAGARRGRGVNWPSSTQVEIQARSRVSATAAQRIRPARGFEPRWPPPPVRHGHDRQPSSPAARPPA